MQAARSQWHALPSIALAAGLVVTGALLPGAMLGNGSGAGVLDARIEFGSLPEGRLAVAIVVCVVAAAILGTLSMRWRRAMLGLGLAGMLAVAGLTVWTTTNAEKRFANARLDAVARDLSDTIGLPFGAVRERLEAQRPESVATSLEPGMIVSLAGAAIGVGSIAVGLTRRSRTPVDPQDRQASA